jgi:hypothetical protein
MGKFRACKGFLQFIAHYMCCNMHVMPRECLLPNVFKNIQYKLGQIVEILYKGGGRGVELPLSILGAMKTGPNGGGSVREFQYYRQKRAEGEASSETFWGRYQDWDTRRIQGNWNGHMADTRQQDWNTRQVQCTSTGTPGRHKVQGLGDQTDTRH